jgi:hypothetical protein
MRVQRSTHGPTPAPRRKAFLASAFVALFTLAIAACGGGNNGGGGGGSTTAPGLSTTAPLESSDTMGSSPSN